METICSGDSVISSALSAGAKNLPPTTTLRYHYMCRLPRTASPAGQHFHYEVIVWKIVPWGYDKE